MPALRPDPLLGQLATVRFDGREYRGAIREVRHEDDSVFGSLLTLTLHLTSTIAPPEEPATMQSSDQYHVHKKSKHRPAERVASYPERDVEYSVRQAAEKALRDPAIMFTDGDLAIVTEDEGETIYVFAVNRPDPRLTLVSEDDH